MSSQNASSKSIYESWLKSKKLLSTEKTQLKKLSPKQIDIQFANKKLTFGTAGVRGVMGMGTTKMNRFTYTNLSLAYGKYLLKINKHRPLKVVVGHDNRHNSGTFALLAAKVLSSLGIVVYLFNKNQLMPTPIVSFTIRHLKLSGGIIITASHNPKEYNGFKVYLNTGGQVLDHDARAIEKLMAGPKDIINITIKPNTSLIRTIPKTIISDYFKVARQSLINQHWKCSFKFPIVFSGHHGTTCKLIPEFLKKFNVKVVSVKEQCFFDPNFTNSPHPNPEDFVAFNLSIKLANKINSKICLGIDPDGDRLAIAIKHHGKWRMMTGNEMGIIYTYYLLNKCHQNKQPFIVSTHVSTNLIDKIAKDFNAKVYRTGTGFKWMGDIVEHEYVHKHFIVAFEEAIGTLVCPINRDKDSFTASLLALEIANDCYQQNMDFIDLLEKQIYPKYGHWFGYTDSFIIKSNNWQQELRNKFKFICSYKSKTFDNLSIKTKCFNKQGNCFEWHLDQWSWIKFRISGTEPKFKIYYNLFGKSQEQLIKTYNSLHSKFKKLLGV